ncbi:hypothetical protein NW759_017000 [Fusarium solani]|nr:hypothetical protein NW759_017000 [Fusarium solani]
MAPLTATPSAGPWDQQWDAAHDKARRSLFSMEITRPKPYANESAGTSWGSGNVVDKSRGLVLTNRHVVGGGPSYGYASYNDVREHTVRLVYSDPVHDYTFVGLRTKQGAVPMDLADQLDLRPDLARRGTEIHRVSNESLLGGNIGQGFIGQVDCNAPVLEETYSFAQDFNTEYISLSMVTLGGSSGSLAFNKDGYAVALTCSGNNFDCFMLPLDLPARALEKIQRGEPVTRGTLQTKWKLVSHNDCRDLGLSQSVLDQYEGLGTRSLVCADVVVPDGPLSGKVHVGDILLRLAKELVKSLVQVEIYMDDHVHETVRLTLWGSKGEYEVECTIEDLHALSTTHLLIRHGSVFQNLALPMAAHYRVPVRGVIACADAQPPFTEHVLLDSIGSTLITDTRQLGSILDKEWNRQHPQRQRKLYSRFRYRKLQNPGRVLSGTEFILQCTDQVSCVLTRQPREGGPWVLTAMSPPTSVPSPFAGLCKEEEESDDQDEEESNQDEASDRDVKEEDEKDEKHLADAVAQLRIAPPDIPKKVTQIFSSLAGYDSYQDILIDGSLKTSWNLAVIFDADQGLAFTFRGELHLFNEIAVTVAEKIDVVARVVFVHPAHDLAVVKLATASVDKGLLKECKLAPPGTALKPGHEVFYVPFDLENKTTTRTRVANIHTEDHDYSEKGTCDFFPFHHQTCRLEDPPQGEQRDGILLNAEGQVLGLVNFFADDYYLPIDELRAVLLAVRLGKEANLRFRDFDVGRCAVYRAFRQDLSREKWEKRLEGSGKTYMLEVSLLPSKQPLPRTEPHPLCPQDLVLEVGGKLVTESAKLCWQYEKDSLRMLVLRNGKEVEVDVPLLPAAAMNVDEVIHFCGAAVQAPNLAARMRCGQLESEVYVSSRRHGGPAIMCGLPQNAFITEVGGEPVQTMAAFLERVKGVPYDRKVRVHTVDADTRAELTVMVEKSAFYPTLLLRRTVPYATGAIDITVVDDDLWQAHLGEHAGFGGNPPDVGLAY